MFSGISWQKHLRFDIILVLMMMRKLVMSNYCIIPVQNILYQFVPVKCKISNRQDAIEYLAINPINRKFHKKFVIKTFKICIIKNSYSKFVLIKRYKICY